MNINKINSQWVRPKLILEWKTTWLRHRLRKYFILYFPDKTSRHDDYLFFWVNTKFVRMMNVLRTAFLSWPGCRCQCFTRYKFYPHTSFYWGADLIIPHSDPHWAKPPAVITWPLIGQSVSLLSTNWLTVPGVFKVRVILFTRARGRGQ